MSSSARTPNVRISKRAHQLLRQLAEETDQSMQAVLDKAIESYRRDEFVRGANRDYAVLRGNAKQWKEVLTERAMWEQTSADGLDK